MKQTQRILILDFGSQYTQLIARHVREANVYCEILPFNYEIEKIREFDPVGIILSGSHDSTHAEANWTPSAEIWNLGVPILGICYGMQVMVTMLGGRVQDLNRGEFGAQQVTVAEPCRLLQGIHSDKSERGLNVLEVWMSHTDQVSKMPEGFAVTAKSMDGIIAAIADDRNKRYGLQFHPEVTHTKQGQWILLRFLHRICGCDGQWRLKRQIDDMLGEIRQTVQSEEVVMALSGGVDSTVAAQLIHRAIGDKLHCVTVDNGLLRNQDIDFVKNVLRDHLKIPIEIIDARQRFMDQLAGVIDPEDKRKTIGKVFYEVFYDFSRKLDNAKWLGQGTIYPDVIESAGDVFSTAQVIKSHHNVGGLPENLGLKVIEPLKMLFKDEVRELGGLLGLPDELLNRHPFPGPGLGVRVLGEIRGEYLKILRHADQIYLEELQKHNLMDSIAQAFCVFPGVKSVGVTGDRRNYNYVIALRAVETVDFMTAKISEIPLSILTKIATRIMNEVPSIARVVYDISSKPPSTIEWE